MPISRANYGAALWPDINSWYGESYMEHKVEYPQIFTTYKSNKYAEEDMSLVPFGLVPFRNEGESVVYQSTRQGFKTRYVHFEVGTGFIITLNMIEDDLYGVTGRKNAQSLAFSMRQTKEVHAANILNRGFNPAFPGGDGSPLFSTTHKHVSGGTWSNRPEIGEDFSEVALEQALITIGKYEDDRGKRINVPIKGLVLPIDLEYDAERILRSPLQAGNSNNDINALKSLGKFPNGVALNHYLTDTKAWFITTKVTDGFKHWEKRPDTFTQDNDHDTDNLKYKATARYSFGFSDPLCAYGSPGA